MVATVASNDVDDNLIEAVTINVTTLHLAVKRARSTCHVEAIPGGDLVVRIPAAQNELAAKTRVPQDHALVLARMELATCKSSDISDVCLDLNPVHSHTRCSVPRKKAFAPRMVGHKVIFTITVDVAHVPEGWLPACTQSSDSPLSDFGSITSTIVNDVPVVVHEHIIQTVIIPVAAHNLARGCRGSDLPPVEMSVWRALRVCNHHARCVDVQNDILVPAVSIKVTRINRLWYKHVLLCSTAFVGNSPIGPIPVEMTSRQRHDVGVSQSSRLAAVASNQAMRGCQKTSAVWVVPA